ncbi:MAG TPA: cupin domain-containing protein [Steroidobacteraceae bacterium]|nr:cupin domain-containing protein [Steroidobacteraceae bacterium]
MASLRKPALDPKTVTAISRSGYPEPYRARVLPRERRALGDALGLSKIGVNFTTLAPGKESAMRHWHTHEDELVYVLEGEVVLRSDGGEQLLRAGMCAGFPAGAADGHQLVNRSARPAVYLEISNRDAEEDVAHYCDADVDMVWNAPAARGRFTRRDGSSF